MSVFTNMRFLFWSKVIPTTLLIALSACTTTYTLKVDAISNPETAETNPQSYIIVNTNPDIDESDLRYQETAKWVKTALSGKGLYEAPNLESADMIIELEYGMEEPYERSTVVQDVRIETEPPSFRTIWVSSPIPGNPPIRQTIVVHGRTRTIPIQRTITQTIYEKYLRITAFKAPDNETVDTKSEQLWSVHVTNEDTDDNLREYLPIMASAAIDFIGKDSGTEKKIRIKEDDEVVTFVKEGL